MICTLWFVVGLGAGMIIHPLVMVIVRQRGSKAMDDNKNDIR
jgi:hypothetical protein